TDRAAVDGERRQAIGLEEAEQELDGEIGGDRGGDRPDQRLAADVVALRAEQLRQLEDARGTDDRGGEQGGEPGGLLVGEARGGTAARAGRRAGQGRDPGT